MDLTPNTDLDYFHAAMAAQQARARANSEAAGYPYLAVYPDGTARTPACHTNGDLVGGILAIHDPADARRFYLGHVASIRRRQADRGVAIPIAEAEAAARSNIGYAFGEGMPDADRAMWREVCDAAHPVLGAMVTRPDPAETLALGIAYGKALRARAGEAPLDD